MEFTTHRQHKRLILKLVLHCKFYRLFRKRKFYFEKKTYDFSFIIRFRPQVASKLFCKNLAWLVSGVSLKLFPRENELVKQSLVP